MQSFSKSRNNLVDSSGNLNSGDLFLRRHQAREAEPKDYDIKDYRPEKRDLHNSTYRRIGNATDGVGAVRGMCLH